jgi:hypothetical protein
LVFSQWNSDQLTTIKLKGRITMTKRFYDDDNDTDTILRDGQRLRVPLMMRDGITPNPALSARQRAIAASRQRDAQQDHMTVVDALGRSDQLHLRRLGARYFAADGSRVEHATQQTLRAMRGQMYDDIKEEVSNRWRTPSQPPSAYPVDAKSDAMPVTDSREAAYEAHDAWLRDAWRYQS